MKYLIMVGCIVLLLPSVLAQSQVAIETDKKWRGDFPRLSAFEAVRWHGDAAEVRVRGDWYELLSLDDQPMQQIVSTCQKLDDDNWRKRFEEDLVEVLARGGHQVGPTVALLVKNLKTQAVQTIADVPMTEKNRQALLLARINQEGTSLSRPEAQEDLDYLQQQLETRYAYLKLRHVDYGSAISAISKRLNSTVDPHQLGIEIAKLLAVFGDGHTRVGDLDEMLPPGYAPFLIGDSDEGLVAFREDRSDFVDANYPLLVKIDDVPVEKWLAAAGALAPNGSPQLRQYGSTRLLRYVNYLRGELHLPARNSLTITLASIHGSAAKTLELPVGVKKPVYGAWPRGGHRLLDGNIGYVRLATMDDHSEFLDGLSKAMQWFRGTRGLIIDVRGNGGGSRAPLRKLFPYFMRADDPPHVFNVAAYRLGPGQKADEAEGYLSDRGLYPITSLVWSGPEREVLRRFASGFKPAWRVHAGDFSAWHYAALSPTQGPGIFHYDQPVVLLMDSACFSATDIFLSAFKGWRNVTLVGSPSGGGSGRPQAVELPNSRIHIDLSSMVSFSPDGQLIEGRGTIPDQQVHCVPSDFIAKSDSVLQRARLLITAPGAH